MAPFSKKENKKNDILYNKTDQSGNNCSKRHNKAEKINFTENAGIGHKGIRGRSKAAGKKSPINDAGHIKQGLRYSISKKFRKLSKE